MEERQNSDLHLKPDEMEERKNSELQPETEQNQTEENLADTESGKTAYDDSIADYSDRPVVIQMQNIKKKYRLGSIGGRTLQADIQSWWARKRGKDDPNIRIGTDTRLIGQEFMALNGIDLKVYQGERLGIIGANGAGKSTLLKLIARITAPTEGEIDLWGRVSSMLEVGTGFHGELTGRENVYMNGAILGMTKAEIDERMEDIIDFSEVREFIDTPVKRYSSGMFVKLAFSVAAHLKSEIMIMDEVLAVGDMAFQAKCLKKMREAADLEGRTVLYVSHNMTTIRSLCERCIVLDQGKLIFDGDVEDAIALYMDRGLGGSGVDVDLSQLSNAVTGLDTGLALEHLNIMDKVTPTFEPGEIMKLKIRFRVSKPLSHVVLRLTLMTDAEVSIGVSYTPERDYPEPGMYEMDVNVPLEHMVRGRFYINLGFFVMMDNKGNRLLDTVERAIRFDVHYNGFWNTKARGFMQFPELKADITKK